MQLCGKVTDLLSRLGETPETFTGRILFMSMFNDISCDNKGNEEECLANAKVVSILAKKFGIGQWSFIGPGSEKKWYSMEDNSPQGIWDHIAEKMLLEFAESGCPIFRATTPLSRCKLRSKGHGKLSIHFAADQETIETIFRIIVFANQLSLYGAVANMCEEFESLHDRSGQPGVVMGQSIVLSEIKAEVPLENDDPSYQNFPLQRYEERIKSLSHTDRVSKSCMDAGFLSVVEIEQYFMTKDNGEQFYAKACREYTLPRSDGSSQPKGWIQGNTKIGPVLEVTTSWLYGKHGVEIRIWSLSEDNTQSWVRISHGSNKFVIDSNNNTESPEDLPEEQASQLKVKDFAARSKAKAKPQTREPVDYSLSIIPMNERKWIDIETGNSSLSVNTIPPNTEKWLRKLYMKTMATVKSYENECDELQHHNQENWNDAHNNKQLTTTSTPMTTLTSTIAWRTTCIESAHIAHCSQSLLMIHIAPHGSSSERIHNHLHSIHGALSLIRLLPFLLPFPPVCPRLPLPPRAVH